MNRFSKWIDGLSGVYSIALILMIFVVIYGFATFLIKVGYATIVYVIIGILIGTIIRSLIVKRMK